MNFPEPSWNMLSQKNKKLLSIEKHVTKYFPDPACARTYFENVKAFSWRTLAMTLLRLSASVQQSFLLV